MTSNRHPLATDARSLLSLTELCDYLGDTERHLRRLVAERRIPFLKLGRYLRFDPREIDDWLEGLRRPARRLG